MRKDLDIVEIVIDGIEKYLDVPDTMLYSKIKDRHLVEARMVAAILIMENTNLSTTKCGKLIGGRHHATIIHYQKQHAALVNTDVGYQKKFETVRAHLLSHIGVQLSINDEREVLLGVLKKQRDLINRRIASLEMQLTPVL